MQVHVNVPGTPEGAEVEVPGLGVFANGSSYEVTEEQVATFNAINLNQFPEDGELHIPNLPVENDEDTNAVDADSSEVTNPFFGRNVHEEETE